MQVKELKKDTLSCELEITVTAQDIDKKIDERLQEVGRTIKMPGFRPGKVPLNVLKQRYGKAVLGEVLERAVNDSSAKVIQDKKLKPALQPKIEVKEFDAGKDLIYTMALEVLPEFEVMDLKGIKLERMTAKPPKEKLDEALESVAKSNQDTSPISSDRASKKGDILLIDYHGKKKEDGKEYPGMHAHDHKLELGSGQFIPGFEEQLTGKKAGEKVEVEVTFPDPYHMAELAGAVAIFDVDIKEIHEAKTPAIDDELAKKVGFTDGVDALREAIEKQMQSEYDQVSRMKLKRALLDILDDKHEFPVPAGMLELEHQSIMQQVRIERQDEVKDGKLELSKDEEEELQAIAERRVRLGMILSEIGQKNNIQVTDQELQRAVIAEAQRHPGQEAQVFEYFRQNQQALDSMRAPVFEDKVVDFIFEMIDIKDKEVSLEELTADDEEEENYLSKKKGKKSGGSKSTTSSKKASSTKKSDTKKTTKSKAKSSSGTGKAKKTGTKK